MRLLFVLPTLEPYSPRGLALSTIVRHSALELSHSGHHVVVVTPHDELGYFEDGITVLAPNSKAVTRWSRAVVIRVASRLGHRRRADRPWHRHIRKAVTTMGPFDACVSMNDVGVASALERVGNRPMMVVWLQNELAAIDRRQQHAIETVDRFVCCSSYIGEHAGRTSGHPERVRVVPSGVDTASFRPRAPGQRRGPIRFLFVGRLDPNKGVDVAVNALGSLAEEGWSFELTVAGPQTSYGLTGERYSAWLHALFEDLANAGGRYVGHVERPDLPSLYASHDVALVLSRSAEPFGLVALEALASGLVVVTSGRGGLRDATGQFAVEINPDDPAAVRRAFRDILSRPDAYQRMAEDGAAWAATQDWAVVAQRLIDALAPLEVAS